MKTGSFRQGAVIFIEGRAMRMLRKLSGDIWQMEEQGSGRIAEVAADEIRLAYLSGRLTFPGSTAETKGQTRPGSDITDSMSPEAFRAAKTRRTYVKAIAGLPCTRQIIGPVIRALWERTGEPSVCPHFSTVLRWRKRFIETGEDFHALTDLSHKKGNRTARFPPPLIEAVLAAIDTKYMRPERGTIQDVLDEATIIVRRENRLLAAAAALPMPTRRLVKRLINEIPAYDRHLARHGRDSANNAFRAVTGFRTTKAPLERAEIDHTPLDMFVVDDETGMPLGRPYLTTCIDTHSRCVLGIAIGFEPPSYLTVSQCIRHTVMPKDDIRTQFPSVRNTWAAHGIPDEILVDNGAEFHSESLEAACLEMGTELHYAPRKCGAFKGKIERFQKTLNDALAHGSPGTTFSNIFEKEDYDPASQAVIGLGRFKEILHIWIVDVYHQKPHRAIGSAPAAVWQSSISPEDIRVPADPSVLEALLGRIEKGRRLTHKGIELDGLFYNSPALTEVRRRLGNTLVVDLRVDDGNLGRIAVIIPGEPGFIRVDAVDKIYAAGLTRWQHRVCRRYSKMRLKDQNSASWLDAKEEISRLISEEFLKKGRKGNKRAARFKTGSNLPSLPAPAVPDTAPDPTDGISVNQDEYRKDTETSAPSGKPTKRFTAIPSVRGSTPNSFHQEDKNV